MDEWLQRITDFATDLTYDDLPEHVVKAAKERIIDSLGCGLGALGLENGCSTADVGWRVATLASRLDRRGRVIGTSDLLSAESAAFINGCLIRDLDFSDTYPGHHPSDALAGIFSVAPVVGSSGRDLIVAMVISYEISVRFLKSGKFNRKGWDNGYSTGVGAAAAVARLMRASRDQLRHSVAITATANVPMRATRAGQLSMWKGAATAYSVRNAVFGAQLAADGMTGPESPFTGRHGMMELITGPIELDPFPTEGGDFLIPQVKMKYWPVVYNMQALVWAGIDLKHQLEGKQPSSVEVLTYWSAWRESGSEPEKWDPRTRETADHSAPYILAYVLRHGGIDHAAFEPSAYLDDSFRPEMNRISVAVDDDIEAAYPDVIRMRVNATDTDGATYEIEISNPLGHEEHPMDSSDINEKFRRLCAPLLSEGRVTSALRRWWTIEDSEVAPALDLLVDGTQQARLQDQRLHRQSDAVTASR